MSENFGVAALRLAGLAAGALGWLPDTFWNATPSELLASLAPPLPAETPPSREEIAAMIERDAHN
ncbi:phage tail assembly chaperone [Qipengyuania sp. RANM35]|uniref:phage tail assembly chaperone n=1 Tax=Qipengyuania sp. RANM35 TaxID=3068635 RepID=UPI0034DAE5E9